MSGDFRPAASSGSFRVAEINDCETGINRSGYSYDTLVDAANYAKTEQ